MFFSPFSLNAKKAAERNVAKSKCVISRLNRDLKYNRGFDRIIDCASNWMKPCMAIFTSVDFVGAGKRLY